MLTSFDMYDVLTCMYLLLVFYSFVKVEGFYRLYEVRQIRTNLQEDEIVT